MSRSIVWPARQHHSTRGRNPRKEGKNKVSTNKGRNDMCYYNQTLWQCGYWRWGQFKEQCYKQHRIGETCGLKLVFETITDPDRCKLCYSTERKYRRLDKMRRDIKRWYCEGNRTATIERTSVMMCDVERQIIETTTSHQKRAYALLS